MFGYVWEYGYCMVATFLLSLWVFARRGFDVVHAHNPPDTFVFIAAFYKLFGKKFVFDHHDLSPEMYMERFCGRGKPSVFRVLIWLEKLTCRLADHVIATNESYKAVQMDRGRVPPGRITIVRNGPDLTLFKPVAADEEIRRKAPAIVGFVGAIGHQDGVDYLLRALHRLIHDLQRRDFYCLIVGGGDAVDHLQALTDQLQLRTCVEFTGSVPPDDVPRYISAFDICVSPEPSNAYTDRSTMIKIMEYMAMSKPVVAFDLPEHRVSAGDAALYAKRNDELEFARHLACLMDDPRRRAMLGARGRRRVETELAWSKQEPFLREAYGKLGLRMSTTGPRQVDAADESTELLMASDAGHQST
jgi:glycosyltransferase involved in cell wall biosynthesis